MKPETAHRIIEAITIIVVLAAVLLLQGCEINMSVNRGVTKGMSNDEIIAEVKKCNDANLVGQVIFDKQKRYVIGVQCITTIKEAIEQPTGWEA